MADKIDWSSFERVDPPATVDWDSFELVDQEREKPKTRNPFAFANDTVIELANAAASGIGAIGDFVAPGNRASAAIKEFVKGGEESQSDIVKAGKTKFRGELEKSNSVGSDLSAVGSYLLENPVQAVAQAAGSLAGPGLAVSGGRAAAGALGVGARAATMVGQGAGVATGAAMGGGDAAGDAYELVKNIPDDVLLTNKEVADLFAKGMPLSEIREDIATLAARKASVLPAIAGGVAGAFGAEKLLAGGAARVGARGAAITGLVEGAGEAVEEGLAQYEGRRAAQEYDQSIDPTKNVAAMAAMGGALGFGAGAGLNVASGNDVSQAPAPVIEEESAPESAPLQIENKPDPFISFPDGSVGKQSDVDNYIASLPEDQQLSARARLLNIGEPAAKPVIEDIGAAPSVDDAIAAAQAVVAAPTEIDTDLKNQQIDQAFSAHMAGIRQREFDLAEQARRDADVAAMQSQVADQQVEQANAMTQAQGFDAQEPTAMELAMVAAQQRRQLLTTPVSQRPTQEVQNVEVPAAAAPVRNDGIGSPGDLAQEQPSQAQGLAPLQSPVEIGRDDNAAEAVSAVRTSVPGADGAVGQSPALSGIADRRTDIEGRRQVAQMSLDEMRQSLLTSDLTGIPNKRAFEEHVENNPRDNVLYGDLDDFKAINTKLGHDGADQVLRGVGAVKAAIAARMGVGAYHRSGDEFLATHVENATLEAYGKAVQDELAGAIFTITQPDGSVIEHKNVGFSYGTGQNQQLAESKSDEQKDERKRLGLRTGSRGAVSEIEGGRKDNQRDPQGWDSVANQAAVAQAKTVLNAAQVSGKDRLDLLDRVKSGTLSLEDLSEAFPSKQDQVAPNLDVDQSTAGNIDASAARTAASQPSIPASTDQTDTSQAAQQVESEESSQPPKDSNVTLKSTSPRAPSGLSAADVTKSLTRVRAKWLGTTRVNTVQSIADLPADIAERAKADDQTEGFYDPQTKTAYLIADNIKSPERATWVAVHEVVGHGGLRSLKDKTVNEALNLAGANRFVRDLATAIQKDRGDVSSEVSVEEAIAELAAATDANDFQALTDRYGVDVPASAQNGLRGTIARVLEAVRRFLGVVMGKPATDVSDADVRNLIGEQRKAVEAAQEAKAESDIQEGADAEPVLPSRAPTQWIADEPSRLDDFIYMMQDKQVDTKRIVQAISKVSGKIADEFDPRLQETLFSGRSAKATQDFASKELKPLHIEMQARGVTMDDFEEFLHARHAQERNKQIAAINPKMQDGGSGMKTVDADKYLAGLSQAKRKSYDALAKRVDAINAETQRLLVESGLEKQSTIDAWNATYKHYVPLQRAEVAEGTQGIGQGFSVKGGSTRRAMGSSKEVIDILANVAMQRERAILRAEKNRVATATYGLAIDQPNKDFWLAVNPANNDRMTPKQYQEMEFELIALGLDPADAANVMKEPKQRYIDPRTGLVAERINPALRSAQNVMALRVNGEDRFLFFSEKDPRAQRMAVALKNLDADQLGVVLGAAAKVSRWFAAVNTQYNPVFGVVNVTRDVQGALMNLSTTPIAGKQKAVLANTASAMRGIYADIRAVRAGRHPISQWAQLYEEFQKEGGQTGFRDMFADSGERAKALQSEIDQITEGKIKSAGRAIFGWLSDYNETLENSVRLAAYKVGTDNGMSKQRAAAMAKELTVNFNRKGTVALQAGALYAFFNASVQGTARLTETLTGPAGKKIVMGGLILGAMQALMMSAAGFDDGEPPEFVRERSIVIPTGDGKYIAIPMPLGFHVIPSLSRIVTEWGMSGGKNTAKRAADIFGLFASSFNPIGSAGLSIQTIAPTAADPFVALSENRDFTGKPIAREDMSGLKQTPGYTRAKDTASWFGEQLSYYLNLASGGTKYQAGVLSPSPDQIDYLIGQVTGGVGREGMKVEQAITTVFTGEDLAPNKVPLIGRFYGDTQGKSAEASQFYENIKRMNGHKLEIDGRRLNKESVSDYVRENKDAILATAALRTQSEIGDLNKLKRKMMEREDSKERVKMIELQIAGKMKRLNDRIELARKDQ